MHKSCLLYLLARACIPPGASGVANDECHSDFSNIDNYPIEWPHAPEGHDGEFRQACDKLAGQRRVTLRGGGFAAVAELTPEGQSMADRKRGFVIECSAEGLAERR